MLSYMIERLRKSLWINQIAVATSVNSADDALADFCEVENIPYHRGSEKNVLERFSECASLFPKADHIIRVTGDCPLIDPKLLDTYIASYLALSPKIDHYHLGAPHYPRGLDAEIVPSNVLRTIAKEASTDFEKEHVTPFIYQHPERFKSGTFISGDDHSDERWCVDEEADFKLVKAIFERLYPNNPDFGWQDVLQLLDKNPSLRSLNAHVAQKNT